MMRWLIAKDIYQSRDLEKCIFYTISFRLLAFPNGSEGEAFACNAGIRSIPILKRSSGKEYKPTPKFFVRQHRPYG